MRMNRLAKRAVALLAAGSLVLSLGACGSGGEEKESGAELSEFVYVPEYVTMEALSNASGMEVLGDYLYYRTYDWDEENGTSSTSYYRLKLGEEQPEEIKALQALAPDRGASTSITAFTPVPGEDGSYFAVLSDYSAERQSPEGYAMADYYLKKVDAAGTELASTDITQQMTTEDGYNSYVSELVADGEGRLYAATDEGILLFDANCAYYGKVEVPSWINGIGIGKDGKVYMISYGDQGMDLQEVDYNAKQVGKTYHNFPNNVNGLLVPGLEKDFLVNSDGKLMEYDIATEQTETLLNWLDCDIFGDYVDFVAPLEDGRILVSIRDWEDGTTELAYLTKTERSQVPQKEEIVIGTLYQDQGLQNAAVKFNKSQDQYHVSIKQYMDNSNWSDTAYEDARTAMNNDVGTGNGPDMWDLSDIPLSAYAAKGIFEDLNPYLEASEKLSREDFVESVLNAMTYGDRLIGIPKTFSLSTLAAKKSQVGEEMGWTVEDLIALMDANPGADAFDFGISSYVLQVCLTCNMPYFVDWENVTCNFDSEEFLKLLEFAHRFPADYTDSDDQRGEWQKIAAGDVLLYQAGINSASDIDAPYQMFGGEDITFIGYPTVDGWPGCMLSPSDAYGIASSSKHKEGAWAFIEFQLGNSSSGRDMFSWGLSSRKDKLEQSFQEELSNTYEKDENGQVVLDENGEPVRVSAGGWGAANGDTLEIYHATEEEIVMLRKLIEVAQPAGEMDEAIMNIISEETAPYFSGQKTADEAADIIQSKVKIYMSENS